MSMPEFREPLRLSFQDYFPNAIQGGSQLLVRKCPECSKSFPTLGIMEAHYHRMHNAKLLLQCLDCGNVFKRKMALILHYRNSTAHLEGPVVDYKLLSCDICDAFTIVNGFKTMSDVIDHTNKVHGENIQINTHDIGKSYCPMPNCKSVFMYRKGMIEHIQVFHTDHLVEHLLGITGPEKDEIIGGMHHRCQHCTKVYRSKISLEAHVILSHSTSNNTIDKIKVSRKKRKKDPEDSPEKIQLSPSKKLKSSEVKETSISIQPVDGKFNCPQCPHFFTRESTLKVHIQMVHESLKSSNLLLSAEKFISQTGQSSGSSIAPTLLNQKRSAMLASKVKKKYHAISTHAPFMSKYHREVKGKRPKMFGIDATEKKVVPKADVHKIFDETYFDAPDQNMELVKQFYGENLSSEELTESCIVDGCNKRFTSYFSMKRHVAFNHRPKTTANLLGLLE